MEGLDKLIKGNLLPNKKISEEYLTPWMSAISYQRSTKKYQNLKLGLNYLNPILLWKNWHHKQSSSDPKTVCSCFY